MSSVMNNLKSENNLKELWKNYRGEDSQHLKKIQINFNVDSNDIKVATEATG